MNIVHLTVRISKTIEIHFVLSFVLSFRRWQEIPRNYIEYSETKY